VKIRSDAAYDDGFGQTKVQAVLVEDTGHETPIEVDRFSLLRFEPSDLIVMHEAGCRGTAGGDPALVHVEMGWTKEYVAHQVANRKAE
jgi:hypothetical protein